MGVSNNDFTQLTISSPTTIAGSNQRNKIVYRDIIKNGKKGIYLNLQSRTPDLKPSLSKYKSNDIYVYIRYNENLEVVLIKILEGMDRESDLTLKEKFHVIPTLEKYKEDGYIKAKVDTSRFSASFFQQPIEGKNGKKELKNISHEDLQYDVIMDGIYSLKIGGVWRKENTDEAGFSFRVLAVLVNTIQKPSKEEEFEEEAIQELLDSRF